MTIDGSTAPGYAGRPLVEIDANGQAGLVFEAGSDGSKLLALSICRAKSNGVTLNAGSITLNLNYIGLNLKGARPGTGPTAFTSPLNRRTTASASIDRERRAPSQT